MMIHRVRLKNIKNYSDTEVFFHPGVNFIKGKNGAGKSTLIESIGYALFNCYDGRGANEDFLTYGKSEGTIEVEFTGVDGKCYTVMRRLALKQNRRSWTVFETATMTPVELFREEEKQHFLAEAMGLAKERDTAWMFRDIIGVRQGEFKAPFELSAEKRKEYFNRIFGVEEYAKAFDRLLDALNELKKRGELLEKDIAYLSEEAKGLPEKEQELASLNTEAQNARLHLEALKQEAQQLNEGLDILKKQKEERIRTEKEILSAGELIKSLQRQTAERQQQLQNAKKAAEKLKRHEKGYLDYMALKEKLGGLEKRAQERSALKEELSRDEISLNRVKGELAAEVKAMEERQAGLAREAEEVRSKLAEIKAVIEKAERCGEAAREREALWKNLEKSVAQPEAYIERGKGFIDQTLKPKASQRDGLAAAVEELKSAIAEAESHVEKERELEDNRRQLTELFKEESVLKERISALSRYSGYLQKGVCPFFDGKCEAALREGPEGLKKEGEAAQAELAGIRLSILEKQNAIETLKRYEGLSQNLQGQKKQLAEKEEALKACGEELIALASQPAGWDMAVKAGALRQEYAVLSGEDADDAAVAAAFRAYREALPSGSEEAVPRYIEAFSAFCLFVQAIKDKLHVRRVEEMEQNGKERAALAAAKTEEASLLKRSLELDAEARKMEQAQKTHGEKRAQCAAMQEALQKKTEGLKAYEGLEKELEEARAQSALLEEDFKAYIENKPEAMKQAELEQSLHELAENLKSAEERIVKLNLKLEANTYDAAKEDAFLKQAGENSHRTGEEKGRLAHFLENAQRVQAEIEKKRAAEEKLAQASLRLSRIAEAQEIIRNVRAALKTAGPRIAGIFRSRIESRADGIYRSVSRESVNLNWTDQYELELKDIYLNEERVRTFRQLSGGEKMTAALAVRLGLLETFSGAGIGFFDEPTDNMDIARRENLADILKNQCARFSQAFVVSHDDTFDKITDNVVFLQGGEAGGI